MNVLGLEGIQLLPYIVRKATEAAYKNIVITFSVFGTSKYTELYRSGGWDALKEGARSGRKRKLSADNIKWLYTHSARELGVTNIKPTTH